MAFGKETVAFGIFFELSGSVLKTVVDGKFLRQAVVHTIAEADILASYILTHADRRKTANELHKFADQE